MPRRKSSALAQSAPEPHSRLPSSSAIGQGLYAGNPSGGGLYASGGALAHHKTLMGHKLVGYGLPPALQSQPYSQHYQWSVTLPPQYQQLAKGNGLY